MLDLLCFPSLGVRGTESVATIESLASSTPSQLCANKQAATMLNTRMMLEEQKLGKTLHADNNNG
jgi:hypothetical protein